jgi:hypothetical protein
VIPSSLTVRAAWADLTAALVNVFSKSNRHCIRPVPAALFSLEPRRRRVALPERTHDSPLVAARAFEKV